MNFVPDKYRHFVLYCLIGGTGATLDFLIYLFLTQLFSVNYQLANFLGVTAGILNNFWWNARYNFKTTDRILARLFFFYAVGMLGWGISAVLLYAFIEKMYIHIVVSKILTIGIVTIIQFVLNKFITFSRNKC